MSPPAPSPDFELTTAREHVRAGRTVDAERSYQRVLAMLPNHVEALIFLANSAQARGDGGHAVNLLSRASKADPSNVNILMHLGAVYQSAERFDAARYVLERAVRLSGGRNPHARLSLARVLELEQRPDLAMLHYFRALIEAQRIRWPQQNDASFAGLRDRLAHAKQYAAKERRVWFERALRESAPAGAAAGGARVAAALDLYLGEQPPTLSDPQQRAGLMYVPGIETARFIDCTRFDWLDSVPDRIARCDDEMRSCLASPASRSHIQVDAGAIRVHALRAGVLQYEARQHAPTLLSTLRELPLAEVLHHAPDVDILALQCGGRFPRHYGRSNSRCWVIVNPVGSHSIQVSVGGESRVLQPATTLVLDPSFGVEYLNVGEASAVALVFEVGHPNLSSAEQQALAALLTAMVEFDVRLQELD